MKITFNTPVVIGDLQNRITVASMQLKSLSINFNPPKGAPNVLISLVLTDPVSGYDAYFEYQDSTTTPAFVSQVQALQLNSAPWLYALIQRLQTDGKLPAGTLS